MREKLIGILDVIGNCNAKYCCDCEFSEDVEGCVRRQKEIIADHLIANGVTVQELDGCDYCREDADGYRVAFGAFSLHNPFHNGEWEISTGHCKPRRIYFCPMCGRRLPQPPKGE